MACLSSRVGLSLANGQCFSVNQQSIPDEDLTVHVGDLTPGTRYEVRVAALQKDPDGTERETYSPSSYITTTGRCE